MIDIDALTGSISVGNSSISPALTRRKFTLSHDNVIPITDTSVYFVYKVDVVTIRGEIWSVLLSFNSERLQQVRLSLSNEKYRTWGDWSIDSEKDNLHTYRTLLEYSLGERSSGEKYIYRYDWGNVEALCDSKSGGSCIIISYK